MNKGQLQDRLAELTGEEVDASLTIPELKEAIKQQEKQEVGEEGTEEEVGPDENEEGEAEAPEEKPAETLPAEKGEDWISEKTLDKAVMSISKFGISLAQSAFADRFTVVYMLDSLEDLKDELAQGKIVHEDQLDECMERLKGNFVHVGVPMDDALEQFANSTSYLIDAVICIIKEFNKTKK